MLVSPLFGPCTLPNHGFGKAWMRAMEHGKRRGVLLYSE